MVYQAKSVTDNETFAYSTRLMYSLTAQDCYIKEYAVQHMLTLNPKPMHATHILKLEYQQHKKHHYPCHVTTASCYAYELMPASPSMLR